MGERYSEQVVALAIARQYFLEGRTKSEIGDAFGLSRFKIARVIDKCLSDGLVEIVFHYPDSFIDYDLSSALRTRLKLNHAIVVSDAGLAGNAILDPLGKATATLLREITSPDDVLGFAWTRTFEAMTGHLDSLKAKAVVQLCGAFPGSGGRRTSVEIVRDVAEAVGGRAYPYYAPLVTSDPAAAKAIMRQADYQAARAMFPSVTKAVVTIGAWREGHSTVWETVAPSLRADAAAQGAVAEICGGIYLDADGQPVETRVGAFTIGIRPYDLAAIPEVVGITFGVEKAAATRAAIRGRFITSLVSHTALAEALLTA